MFVLFFAFTAAIVNGSYTRLTSMGGNGYPANPKLSRALARLEDLDYLHSYYRGFDDENDLHDYNEFATSSNVAAPIGTNSLIVFPFHIDERLGAYRFDVVGAPFDYYIVKILSPKLLKVWAKKKKAAKSTTSTRSTRQRTIGQNHQMDKELFAFVIDLHELVKPGYIQIDGKKYKTTAAWYMPQVTGSARLANTKPRQPMPLNMALQRMNIMANVEHYFVDWKTTPIPFRNVEDAASLAAIAMITYKDDLPKYATKSRPFYGGQIVKVVDIKNVKVKTHLTSGPTEIDGGDLRLIAWESPDIYVVAIRGTHDNNDGANWNINFQIIPEKVSFTSGSHGKIEGHLPSGVYHAVKDHLAQMLTAFDKYNGQKRIIITGHSMGSALAQILIMEILNRENEKLIRAHPKMKELILYDGRHESSLEVITFGGPAVMPRWSDRTHGAKFTKRILRAIRNMNNGKLKGDAAIVYVHENDPIGFTGDDLHGFIQYNWCHDGAGGDLSRLASKLKFNYFDLKVSPTARKMAAEGLRQGFVTERQHLGKVVKTRNQLHGRTSHDHFPGFSTIKEPANGEYLDMVPTQMELRHWLE